MKCPLIKGGRLVVPVKSTFSMFLGTIKAARILLPASLVINCLVNVVAILMKIFKGRLMMDVLSVMILISSKYKIRFAHSALYILFTGKR